MKCLDPGHRYELLTLDGEEKQILQFVKREGEKFPGNEGTACGTTLQEVIRALIDRVDYLNNQVPDQDNVEAIGHLAASLFLFEKRAARRHNRTTPPILEILNGPFCDKCLHAGCKGGCHV